MNERSPSLPGAPEPASKTGHTALNALAALEGFHPVKGAREVRAQQPGETSVSQDLSAGLAASTVVGFVVGVANALDGITAARAGLAEAAMYRHLRAKRCDLFGEAPFRFGPETGYPKFQRGACGSEEAVPFFRCQFLCAGHGGKLCGVQNLVGIGIADAADGVRVGECFLDGVVPGCERGAEAIEVCREYLDAAGIDGAQAFFAAQEMQGSEALAPASVKVSVPAGKSKAARALLPLSLA